METDVLTTDDQLRALLPEWREIADSGSVPFYSRPEVVQAWWAANQHRPELQLRIVTAREGRLLGVAALVHERPRKGAGTVRFASVGDYRGFTVAAGADSAAVVGNLMAAVHAMPDWKRLILGNVPSDDPLSAEVLRSEHNPAYQMHVENPYIDLQDVRSATVRGEDFFPKSHRKAWRRFHRGADATLELVRGPREGLVSEMAALHVAEKDYLQGKGREERHSLYENPDRRAVYDALYARVETLTAVYRAPDGELLAHWSGIVDGDRLLVWNSAYSPAVAHLEVGRSLRYEAVHHLAEHTALRAVDLGAGRYAWKFRMTPRFTSTYKLDLRREPPSGRGVGAPAERPVNPSPRTPSEETTVSPSTPAPKDPASKAKAAPAVKPAVAEKHHRPQPPRPRPVRTRVADWVLARKGAVQPPVIWYAPHPDDETIFMGGSIAAHRGRRNILVSLSRGAASSARNKLGKRLGREVGVQEFTDARVAELKGALAHLGVDEARHVVHDVPDGGFTVAAVRAVMEEMAARYPAAEHRTMSFHDPHSDHATAGRALAELVDEGVIRKAVWHVPVSHLPDGWGEEVDLPQGALWAKKRALREYQAVDRSAGRHGIGGLSVTSLIADQFENPRERTHGREVEAPPSA